jgi:hypothetical protein
MEGGVCIYRLPRQCGSNKTVQKPVASGVTLAVGLLGRGIVKQGIA